jgi:hypothetical protein
MAKLPTVKKLDKQTNKIVDYGLQRVTEWTKKELEELQRTSETPIIVPLQNGNYIVATNIVEKINNTCWKVNDLEFLDKRSAIFYCALNYLRKFQSAAELFATDQKASRYEMDKIVFRKRLDKAHIDGDEFKIGLYSSRYEEAKCNLVNAKQDLEKIITKTKYIQGLGNQYET